MDSHHIDYLIHKDKSSQLRREGIAKIVETPFGPIAYLGNVPIGTPKSPRRANSLSINGCRNIPADILSHSEKIEDESSSIAESK